MKAVEAAVRDQELWAVHFTLRNAQRKGLEADIATPKPGFTYIWSDGTAVFPC